MVSGTVSTRGSLAAKQKIRTARRGSTRSDWFLGKGYDVDPPMPRSSQVAVFRYRPALKVLAGVK
jgi:hypothetical protein